MDFILKKKYRSFLKWAGGKYSLVDQIRPFLPDGEQLIEPFTGAGSIFLNTNYDSYLLADINVDLISLFKTIKRAPKKFVREARELFGAEYNSEVMYYKLRDEFNQCTDQYRRSLLFLYLNRHCYNGLCRYNMKGEFNVPFGRYNRPYFPEDELYFFSEKAQKAKFVCGSYHKIMALSKKDSVVYCDPPYTPLSKTAHFTSYFNVKSFTEDDQINLVKIAKKIAKNHDVPVIISNHDTDLTRFWYKDADLFPLKTRRYISSQAENRSEITELLAIFR